MAGTQEFYNKQYLTIMPHYLEEKYPANKYLEKMSSCIWWSGNWEWDFCLVLLHSIFSLTKKGIVRKLILPVGCLTNISLTKITPTMLKSYELVRFFQISSQEAFFFLALWMISLLGFKKQLLPVNYFNAYYVQALLKALSTLSHLILRTI